jgi:hypothetical protein
MNSRYLIRAYPLITIYYHSVSLSSPLFRIDLRKVKLKDLADLSFFAERSSAHVYAAQDPLRFLTRTEQGNVKAGACLKVTPSQLKAVREALVKSLHRHVSEASLANLRTASRFTSEARPNKPRKYPPKMILKALAMKASGLSWASLGERLGANPRGLESACRSFAAR